MTRGQVAAKVRQEKAEHPERFCLVQGCLWRTVTAAGPNPCQKHPDVIDLMAELKKSLARAAVPSPEGR